MPPRNKKIVEESPENAIEETIEEPIIPEPEVESDDSTVKRIISKVKQVITLKKVLTAKQQAHLDRLAATRLGKKTTYKEIPVETVPLPQKKKRTVKPKVEPIVPVKIVKPRVKKPIQVFQEPIINLSRFNKNLF